MKLALIGLAIVNVLVFCWMLFSRERKRGTYGFHRHPEEVRRKRGELIEFDTIEIRPYNFYLMDMLEQEEKIHDKLMER